MLAIFVDFNAREVLPDGGQAAAITLGIEPNLLALEQKLVPGLRVIIYDTDERCEGVLRHGSQFDWVADFVPGTFKELTDEEFEQMWKDTMHAADTVE